MTLPDFVWGTIGAAVSWPLFEFLARPLRQFFDIRRQVARCLAEYAMLVRDIKKSKAANAGGDGSYGLAMCQKFSSRFVTLLTHTSHD